MPTRTSTASRPRWARWWATTVLSQGDDSADFVRQAYAFVEGLPLGPVTYRAIDHQSTMGAYVGRLAVEDGRGVMVDIEFKHGADFLPSDEEVKQMRPQ